MVLAPFGDVVEIVARGQCWRRRREAAPPAEDERPGKLRERVLLLPKNGPKKTAKARFRPEAVHLRDYRWGRRSDHTTRNG